ncbi:hypothetical protein ACHAXN_012228 [Cyclotella atomus]|jgi:hypothetical protein
MATSDEDDGFNAFLAFLQSDTKDDGKIDKKPAQSNGVSSNDNVKKEQQQQQVDNVAEQPNNGKLEDIAQATSSTLKKDAKEEPPPAQAADEKEDEKGFLDFLSFVYDVPLEPEEPNEEKPKDNEQHTKDQLQSEENEAWEPIEPQSKSTADKPHSETEDIVTTSKNIMKEIIASDEDASRQKNKYMMMELSMLFSLAGEDESGGSKVGNIFSCLKSDATKGKIPLG